MANLRDPRPNQIIHGKPRGQWVKDAARSMIASTDAALLWKIVRVGGYFEFDRVARPAFARLAGFHFTVDEIRWIFNHLDQYVTGLEKSDRAHMTVNRAAKKFEQEEREEFLDDTIITESVSGAVRGWTNAGQRIH